MANGTRRAKSCCGKPLSPAPGAVNALIVMTQMAWCAVRGPGPAHRKVNAGSGSTLRSTMQSRQEASAVRLTYHQCSSHASPSMQSVWPACAEQLKPRARPAPTARALGRVQAAMHRPVCLQRLKQWWRRAPSALQARVSNVPRPRPAGRASVPGAGDSGRGLWHAWGRQHLHSQGLWSMQGDITQEGGTYTHGLPQHAMPQARTSCPVRWSSPPNCNRAQSQTSCSN